MNLVQYLSEDRLAQHRRHGVGEWAVAQLFRVMIRYNLAGLDASIYVLTAVLTLGATLLAISWEIGRAARANPADSLRYE